ncbi:BQ5605_C001g00273 [Microbotryum silenes-dioicae]|uniref:BQ5605_C001g00273 protein n=1 Tax=Microbotryum silenes-dioicae TaxID=796604 RepID=A0A2X0M2T1_9BASI|nr:BQ5605_C001g00273 [Microbotryum silenes-dioicae]
MAVSDREQHARSVPGPPTGGASAVSSPSPVPPRRALPASIPISAPLSSSPPPPTRTAILRSPTSDTLPLTSVGHRRRRSFESSLQRRRKRPEGVTGAQHLITNTDKPADTPLGKADEELKRFEQIVTDTTRRCHAHRAEIEALQKEIKARSQHWNALLKQSCDAKDRAKTSSEQVLRVLPILQDTRAIADAKRTTAEVSVNISHTREAFNRARGNLFASEKEGLELQSQLVEEEAMLIKVHLASKMMICEFLHPSTLRFYMLAQVPFSALRRQGS